MNRLSDEKYEILRRSTRAWLVKLMERKSLAVSSSVDEAEEDDVMLEQKFRQWEQEFIQKGMLAGEEKGRLEGRQVVRKAGWKVRKVVRKAGWKAGPKACARRKQPCSKCFRTDLTRYLRNGKR